MTFLTTIVGEGSSRLEEKVAVVLRKGSGEDQRRQSGWGSASGENGDGTCIKTDREGCRHNQK